jgi:hypothetical protein
LFAVSGFEFQVSGSFIRDSLLNAGIWLSVVFAYSLNLAAVFISRLPFAFLRFARLEVLGYIQF